MKRKEQNLVISLKLRETALGKSEPTEESVGHNKYIITPEFSNEDNRDNTPRKSSFVCSICKDFLYN